MAITIHAPSASFIQFTEMDTEHCTFGTVRSNLPVYDDDDIAFQFVLQTDTIPEADALSAVGNDVVKVGLASTAPYEPLLIEFSQQAERFRIGERQVLYNWYHGFPNFGSVIEVGECFKVQVTATLPGAEYIFKSNRFERIDNTCFTSVLEYGSEDNGFGFNYCSSAQDLVDVDAAACAPTRISFTNMTTLTVPYTASLQQAYGALPTVQAWIYDESGELVNAGIEIKMDGAPPTQIVFDFGGVASGICIIK